MKALNSVFQQEISVEGLILLFIFETEIWYTTCVFSLFVSP